MPELQLYRAKVIPVYQGHWQENKWSWEYTQAVSLEQAGHNLRQRFPPPNWHLEPVILDLRNPSKEGDMRTKEPEIKQALEPILNRPRGLSSNYKEKLRSEKITCSEGLKELNKWLKDQIKDEWTANASYDKAHQDMDKFNLPIFSDVLLQMSSDEANHALVLETIVDVITGKCECNPCKGGGR